MTEKEVMKEQKETMKQIADRRGPDRGTRLKPDVSIVQNARQACKYVFMNQEMSQTLFKCQNLTRHNKHQCINNNISK